MLEGRDSEWLIHDAGQPIQEGHGSIESLTEALAAMDPPLVDPEAAVLISSRGIDHSDHGAIQAHLTNTRCDPFSGGRTTSSIDDHFIGLGRREGDQLSVVVLRQEIMRSVIDAFDEAGIRVEFIGIDSQLLQHEHDSLAR